MIKIRPALLAATLLIILQPVYGSKGGGLEFTKLTPFTDSQRVRIFVELKSTEGPKAIDLEGEITQNKTKTVLWKGTLGKLTLQDESRHSSNCEVSDLKPELWKPISPTLYNLTVTAKLNGQAVGRATTRFGFRSFGMDDGHFVLNGKPIFLRGLAINPPERTIPSEVGESRKFAEAYVRFLKSQNVNTIRMTRDSQIWFDVCDELGMMVYQGQYGSPLGSIGRKQEAPGDFEKSIAEYKHLFETYASHPSILIYILSNELPTSGTRGKAFHEYLQKAHAALKPWDPTRLYIGNAGYGEGREGDICDVHRYWGWYYNTFLTYYNLRDDRLYGDPNKKQPLTFTECVGNFTGPLGEYNIILKKQLGAQLNWTGHSPDQRTDALTYQAFMVKRATESFRRLRPLNPRLSGLMPFTILFYNWSGIQSFEQMKPKPAMTQMAISYQPVLLSWEMWTPQVYSGSRIHPIAHVINDAEDGLPLDGARLRYQIISPDGHEVFDDEFKLPQVPYYGTWSKKLEVALSPKLPSGDYRLSGQILLNGRVISHNEESIFIAGDDWLPAPDRNAKPSRHVQQPDASPYPAVYDPAGRTSAALRKLGVQFYELTALSGLPTSGGCLVIGEDSWDSTVPKAGARLKTFMANGGRILCLRQTPASFDTSWLPETISFFTASANAPTYPPAGRPFSGNMNINPERPGHPVFHSIGRRRLGLWSDYKNWDETKAGFPELYPVTGGFKCLNPEAMARTAILADYDRGLEGIALCEMFSGKGSVILSGFDLVARSGLDPIADRMLLNLVRFAAAPDGHDAHPLIQNQIDWGNYASESGIIAGPANGLVVNADWVRPATNPSAKPLTQAEGAWNTKPGDQFVPHGRRLLGPYGYSTASSLKDMAPDSKNAAGIFWARIPPGKTKVVTSVENRSSQAADFSVAINESAEPVRTTVGPAKIIQVSAPINAGATDISVRYQGSKDLILLTTSFE